MFSSSINTDSYLADSLDRYQEATERKGPFTSRQLEIMNYNRKHWSPFRLAETRKATMANATEYCPINRKQQRVSLVKIVEYELYEQREEFALRHHAGSCACRYCTNDREIREEAYELEAEVGMAAHYEAMEMLEEEQRGREEAPSWEEQLTEHGMTQVDYDEFVSRNIERGTAYTHWY